MNDVFYFIHHPGLRGELGWIGRRSSSCSSSVVDFGAYSLVLSQSVCCVVFSCLAKVLALVFFVVFRRD